MRKDLRNELIGSITFSPLWKNDFFKDFDRIFDEAFRPMALNIPYPPMDIYVEKDEDLVFEVALAGWKKDEVKIEIEKNVLYIESNTQIESEDNMKKKRKYIKHKIARRQFKLAYTIPDVYDVDSPDASFEDGVLMITFSKKEVTSTKRKQIELG